MSWTLHHTPPPESRPYWHHPEKGTTWQDPTNVWRTAKTKEGKTYWWHSETRETRWDDPNDEVDDFLNTIQQQQPQTVIKQEEQMKKEPEQIFLTAEDAHDAFDLLLRKFKVDESWTWQRVMTTLIDQPVYRAIKKLEDRKAAFEAYVKGGTRKERVTTEERERRISSLMPFSTRIDR